MKIESSFGLRVEENPDPGVYRVCDVEIRLTYAGDDPLRGFGRLHALLGRAWEAAPYLASIEATATSLKVGWRPHAERFSGRAQEAWRGLVVDAWRDVFDGGSDDVTHFVVAAG